MKRALLLTVALAGCAHEPKVEIREVPVPTPVTCVEPETIPELRLKPWGESLWLPRLLKECGLAPSTTEARRLIVSGAVTVDGEKVGSADAELPGAIGRSYRLRVGKRKYLQVVLAPA